MPGPPAAFLDHHKEPGVWHVFPDRKIYHLDKLFFKRTLRRHEWTDLGDDFLVQPTATMPQRYRTDAAVQKYVREHTNIPLPTMTTCFEDDGAMCLAMEFLPGVQMDDLPKEDRQVVAAELEQHLETLKALRSDTPGVPGEPLLIAPQRVTTYDWHYHSCWRPRPDLGGGDFVFCHNDLGQHNVLVDPATLKITAILDWEFSGFWPAWFERPFWMRAGACGALEGEEDDVERCRAWLLANCEEVEMQHMPTLGEKLTTLPMPESPGSEGVSEKGAETASRGVESAGEGDEVRLAG